MTWYGALAYCNYLSDMDGFQRCINFTNWTCNFAADGYRLPTEAEWEKAARGGRSGLRFPWGDTVTHSNANYRSDAAYVYDVSATRDYHPVYCDLATHGYTNVPWTSQVGAFDTNGYGICDMAGNAWEWCWDRYRPHWYSDAASTNADTAGPTNGLPRVMRGGCLSRYAGDVRCSARSYYLPDNSFCYWGFRTVRKP